MGHSKLNSNATFDLKKNGKDDSDIEGDAQCVFQIFSALNNNEEDFSDEGVIVDELGAWH